MMGALIIGPWKRNNDAVIQEPVNNDMFSQYDYQMKCFEARFGDKPLPQGFVYKQTFKDKKVG